MTIKWRYGREFTCTFVVAETDIDGLQHTNNGVYVRWCEQTAWAHTESLALGLDRYRELDRAMVITRSEYHYLAASCAGDEVVTATWITDWDRRLLMSREFQVVRTRDNTTLLTAHMDFACIELSTGKPKRLPPEFIAGYGPAILTEWEKTAGLPST